MSTLKKKLFFAAIIAGFFILACSGHLAVAGLMIDLDPGSSDSVKLSELLDGTYEGVTIGDKVFDEFVYSTIGQDMPDAEDVNVLGFVDDDGNLGISFHGVFLDLPGGGVSDALIRFTVEVSADAQAAGWRITDAHLNLGGPGVGEDSIITVDESFESTNKILNVFVSSLGQGSQQLADWVDFDSFVTKLRVTKDILAIASENSALPARATVIDQSFSQVQIPEPATLSLLAMSLFGTLLVSRRR